MIKWKRNNLAIFHDKKKCLAQCEQNTQYRLTALKGFFGQTQEYLSTQIIRYC